MDNFGEYFGECVELVLLDFLHKNSNDMDLLEIILDNSIKLTIFPNN